MKKEIIHEALVELMKIMEEAFNAGVNMDLNTRGSNGDDAWIVGSLTLEGWTLVEKENQEKAYWAFRIYSFDSEEEVREKLDQIREVMHEMSQYEVRPSAVVVPQKK